MNITPLAERPAWVSQTELEAHRFDSLYYDPSLTIAERLYRSNGKLQWKRLHEVKKDLYSFGAYELTNLIHFVEPGQHTVPFINVTEIGNLYVDIEQARHIDADSHRLLQKSICFPSTVLLSMSGSIGRVAVVPASVKECNSNQHLAKIVIDEEKSDPYFIAAYFASSVGQASCHREAAGAVQKELYLYNISTLPVPDPPRPVQVAIGNKVRAAEILRTEADKAVRSAIQELEKALGWPINLNPAQHAFTDPEGLNSRIDPLPYLPRYASVRELIERHSPKSFREMGVTAVNGCEIRTFVPEGKPYLLVGDLQEWYLRPPRTWEKIPRDSQVPMRASPEEGDLLCVRTGPVGKLVSWEPCYGNGVISSHWIRLKGDKKRGFDAGYLSVLSQLKVWEILIEAIVYGAVQPQVSQEEILDTPIPFVGTQLAMDIGKAYHQAVAQVFRADELTNSAIAEVEALIDETLDEVTCIEAGRKLADEFGLEKS